MTSSFCANFTPSATNCAQPWKAPAYMGPSRPCMCAITLCSACPTTSGSTRKATTIKISLIAMMSRSDIVAVLGTDHTLPPRPLRGQVGLGGLGSLHDVGRFGGVGGLGGVRSLGGCGGLGRFRAHLRFHCSGGWSRLRGYRGIGRFRTHVRFRGLGGWGGLRGGGRL